MKINTDNPLLKLRALGLFARPIFFIQMLCILLSSHLVYASGPDCEDPGAEPVDTPYSQMDGYFVGANSCAYNPALYSSDQVPPVLTVSPGDNTILFVVNGKGTAISDFNSRLESLSTIKQRPVIGIYNAPTEKEVGELIKMVDIFNPAAAAISNEGLKRILVGERFSIHGNSQAGISMTHGLRQLSARLKLKFPWKRAYRKELLNLVEVETSGTIGLVFPNGPQYVHYANHRDIAPTMMGALSPAAHPGKGAVIAAFYYENADCNFDGKILSEYPGENANFAEEGPTFSPAVHSVCAYAATGFPFDDLREFAPNEGALVVPLHIQ